MPGSVELSLPHLTLGRVRDGASRQQASALSEAVAGAPVGRDVEIPVGELALMKSDLRPTGAVYTRLHTARLGG